ncbi:MAG: acetyl-CoA carboxylase biotin carboxylase subunit [candidate division Zixibacteria bacterium]|nr:acetyl-CoA carboxylase biotin carboxylase subunit [candidate division Zixibacteria bacterium]
MIKKVLIANRGEIALRIIRACRNLGIKTVAVYSEADADSLHVRFADEDVCIGPPLATLSYLDLKRIIAAAEVTNADAIHPGYGFLAENAEFADICEECKITFIGPTGQMIRQMGAKAQAKEMMKKANVPIIPGSDGLVKDVDTAAEIANTVGYPVLLKASAGGGGRGMRIASAPEELETAFNMARSESAAAFNDDSLYLEKVIINPHHVEIQLLGDNFGNIIHLGERDCSVQRRHQKLLEESPSPIVNAELRARMGEAAIKGASAVGYRGAGTVEFLVDNSGSFYFMEMNTRVQVEHPVTEELTGIDIVAEQIKIAAGIQLSLKQEDVTFRGHVIECRINAEDPSKGFRPGPGKITSFNLPGGNGVRVDTHAYAQYVIPPYYDSMIGKLIVRGNNRQDAIRKTLTALDEFIIEGIPTTIDFQKLILSHPDFSSGNFDTSFIEKCLREEAGLTK